MFDIKQLDNAYSPQDQLLIALGVHPDQQAAKEKFLDAVQGEGSQGSSPGHGSATPAASPAQPIASAAAPSVASPDIAPIARPTSAKAISLPVDQQTRDQAELDRLKNSPDYSGNVPAGGASGIAKIHNPFLRTIARVGDIAGRTFFPSIEEQIPGTEGHHQLLVDTASGNVNSEIAKKSKEATTAHTQAETEALNNKPEAVAPLTDAAGEILGWKVNGEILGPNNPKLTQDQRDIMAVAHGKPPKDASPDVQTFASLIKGDPASGVAPMSPVEALQKLSDIKASNKPDTAAQHKQAFEAALQKAVAGAGGHVDSGIYSSLSKAADFISKSTALTPDEKNAALAYMGANTTPMSTGTNTSIRVEPQNETPYNVINTQNKEMGVMTKKELAEANKKEPGKWVLSGQGGMAAIGKEANADNIRTSIANVRSYTGVLDGGIKNRAIIAAALADPGNTATQFAQSAAAANLEPAEQDYVISVLNAREQIQGLRTLLQATGNSDKRIAAMIKTLPGASTPSSAYANKQIDTALADIDRELKGVPKVRNKGNEKPPEKKPGKFGFVED